MRGARVCAEAACWTAAESAREMSLTSRRPGGRGLASAASGRVGLVQTDLGNVRPDRALAERTGYGDAVLPVEHVITATALVELDRLHPAPDRTAAASHSNRD